jgi:hypothetical protein
VCQKGAVSGQLQSRLRLRLDNLEEVVEVHNMEELSGVLVDAK